MKMYVLLALAVGLLAGTAISQVIPQRVIGSEIFEVLDQSGRTRAKLGTKLDGRAFLEFYGRNGEVIWEVPPRDRMLPVYE